MTALDFVWLVAGFVAPALVLGSGMALAGWLVLPGRRSRQRLLRHLLAHWLVGLAVLVAGLVLTGHDGRMTTYAALVLASAACALALGRRSAA